MKHIIVAVTLPFLLTRCYGLATLSIHRRRVLLAVGCATAGGKVALPNCILIANAADEKLSSQMRYEFEKRDRKKNKNALIREDYWYMSGKVPPRKLDISQLPADNPKFNAWGSCSPSSGSGGNSCTYVSLNQKIPAYSKYFFSISNGARELAELGKVLDSISGGEDVDVPVSAAAAWEKAASYIDPGSGSERLPSPAVDALRKMILLGTALLTSPNYTGPPFELLVARFYVNEAAYAMEELSSAIAKRDCPGAKAAWEFGRDSWNSYFTVVNRAIVPKVGEKFEMVT